VKLGVKIKSLFRRRPPTDEELSARAEAESIRQQTLQEQASHASAQNTNPPF
jgi:hypothetical protein